MHTAATREGSSSRAINPRVTDARACHQSSGSCSAAPSSGVKSGYAALASPSGTPSSVNRPALNEVVPTSTPSTTSPARTSLILVGQELRHGLEVSAAESITIGKSGAIQASKRDVQGERMNV